MTRVLSYNKIVDKGGIDMEKNKLVEFEETLLKLVGLMNDIKEYGKDLSRKQSDCDREIIDLEHYIEFLDMDDNEVIHVVKEIKKAVTKRREIKDTMSQIESLHGLFSRKVGGVGEIQDVINNFNTQTSRLAERKYKPRIRVDLFERLNR